MKKFTEPPRAELTVGSLKGQFLVSMPSLRDPHFNHSITLICDHSDDGAMGLVLNHPLGELTLGDIFEQMDLTAAPSAAQLPVFAGGPVQQERGFVVHPSDQRWESTIDVSPSVALTASRDILESMAAGTGPHNAIVALGYAGWDGGQLEDEIANNAWITLQADSDLLFNTPAEQRWAAAAKLLGFDLNLISSSAGHA
ncbi:YqgE/AlgH family protein [Simiduia sp. 21SJ11W-1]|uniref:YqgE/AlgH family protein n=1 Tax=Simiduia sp. 21SJ11W-1 TaxID=2909669 RepID=UPI0020A231F4|nr:YqgE/AlgH family protein [Simiduia sp. 21SJ11W-1]UTA48226.1 YqgE/AlgH family protein [Simiduia sp. 21SJ11W-1]